jgi:hypothetical protein
MRAVNPVTGQHRLRTKVPWQDILANPNKWFSFKDDYTQFDTTNGYTATQAVSGSAAISDARHGVLLIDAGATTQHQGESVIHKNEFFRFEAGKEAFFFWYVKVALATTGDDTPLTSGVLDDDEQFAGFVIRTGDTAGTLQFFAKDGTGTDDETVVEDIYLLTTATWVEIAFHYNGAGSLQAYVDGVAKGDPITTNIPDTELAIVYVCQSNGTSQPTLEVDWVEAYVQR